MAKVLQDRDEFDGFCQLMIQEDVHSYLEVGSFSGGSIEMAAQYLPVGSRIVSVDKPWKSTKLAMLQRTMEILRRRGYDTHLIIGDSTDPRVIAKAKELGPYDAVFIDGDHRVPYVKMDWQNYGALGRRIIGFHDIARDMPKDEHGGPHEVASFWNEFKKDFRYTEFISAKTKARTDTKAAYGIGVVWNVQS